MRGSRGNDLTADLGIRLQVTPEGGFRAGVQHEESGTLGMAAYR